MKRCDRSVLYTSHSAKNVPSMTVEPGEVFQVQTQLNTGEWLQSTEDIWHPSKITGSNFTNCLEIFGAKPGDVLAVEILDIQLESVAYTGFDSGNHPICQKIYPNDWGLVSRVVPIENSVIHWDEQLCLEARPMVGTLGVAPAEGEFPNTDSSHHGGNMDVQEVCKGTTVYLPVYVAGALLHVGDVHAIMGDGEINKAGGLECRSLLTLRCRLLPANPSVQWIRMESEEYLMAVACIEDIESAFYEATGELLRWMVQDYEYKVTEAYALLGQVLESRCTAMVNRQKTYISKVKKAYLRPKRKVNNK